MLDLRPVRPGDAGALHALMSDPDVARWLRGKDESGPFTLQECEAWAAKDAAHAGYPHVLYRTIRERNPR